MSSWWKVYVMDERGTFGDLDHPNAQLFAYRFSFSFESVKVQETGEHFWKKKHDAARRESSPVELLVMGSLRILTRNVTLDDLYEQTFISAEAHRCFFQKFMKWYSTRVFPEVIQMPLLGDLDYNGADYSLAVFPGCVCSVDCVHVKVSAKLKQNGAVSSSSLLARKKYNTITSNAHDYLLAYGAAFADAMSYQSFRSGRKSARNDCIRCEKILWKCRGYDHR
jgi:hypothetical protein